MPVSRELLTQEGTRAASKRRVVEVDSKLWKCDTDSQVTDRQTGH